jgi:hypothetical protein
MKQMTIVLLTIIAARVFSQPAPGPYAVIDYFKVQPGKGAAYAKMEKELWKPVHEARKKAGEITGWFCYSIDFSGSSNEYNFVTVTMVDNLAKLDIDNTESWFKKIHPQKKIDDVMKMTLDARDGMKSELARMVVGAFPQSSQKSMPIVQLRFIKADPSSGASYSTLVKNAIAPTYQELVNSGKVPAWDFWELWLPVGSSTPYSHVMAMEAKGYAQFAEDYGFDQAFKKINPNIDLAETRKVLRSVRTVVKEEIWRLIDEI